MLTIKDVTKIEIYKIKYWCLYFRYEGVNYMLRHIDDCGDHWNELTNKETWETISSDYTLFDINDFLKLKYSNKYVRIHGTPYKHIDLEYFVECLSKFKLINYEGKLKAEEPIVDNKNKSCVGCKETITDLEINTVQSGWFSIDKKIKFCPYCGRKL